MKLPWVSRALHESYERQLERQYAINRDWSAACRDLSNRIDDEWRRYDDLLAKYHALRERGFAEPPAPIVVERQKPDPLKQAIAAKCGNNRQLRENMERQAAMDRQAGMSDAEIVLKINAGVSPEETFAVAGL